MSEDSLPPKIMGFMKRINEWLFDTNRPLRFAFVALAVAALNAYEALRVDNPNGIVYIVSWVCAVAGGIGFVAFLLIAISEHFSKD